jgi:L-amino acid N-acyltransferase YncA
MSNKYIELLDNPTINLDENGNVISATHGEIKGEEYFVTKTQKVKKDNGDMVEILKWRNNRTAILYSTSQKKIEIGEHQKWFKKNSANLDNKIYIGLIAKKKKNYKIGMVRFELKSKTIRVSINLNPKFRGMNLSKKFLKLSIKKLSAKKSLIAKIHKDNKRSISCFSSCGFILFKTQKQFMIFKKK